MRVVASLPSGLAETINSFDFDDVNSMTDPNKSSPDGPDQDENIGRFRSRDHAAMPMDMQPYDLSSGEAVDRGGSGTGGDGADDGDPETSLNQNDNSNENQADQYQPSWREMKTKAGKDRKRLPLACIACRRKKIRCSGEKPACKHCTRSRVPCVYKVSTRKAAPRTDYMAMLDRRLKRMEERVIKIIPRGESRDMAVIGRSIVKPTQPGQNPRSAKGTDKKRAADDAFEDEIDEWTRSNNNPLLDSLPLSREWKSSEPSDLLTVGTNNLPSMEIQEHLCEVFFDCVYGQSYLLLHKPSFMRRLKASTVPPVLTLAICAVSARFSTHPQINSEPAFLRGEEWAEAAASIALHRHDEPNITILTVFLLLGLHEFGTCHGGRSWSFGGQALRMAYALQLHRELDRDPLGQADGRTVELSFTDREIRRRTMWACFLMDRYNSSGSQRPPIGNEKFLQIQLPIREIHFQMEIPGPTEDLDGNVPNPVPEGRGQLSNPRDNMGVSAYIIRAIVIWGQIVDYLNLGGKKKDPYPVWDSESGFSCLKQKIDQFNASLPSSLIFTRENLQSHAGEKVANQFLFLHIVMHQNVLFLNQFAIPLAPGSRPPKDMPKSFLSDAGRAAVEAAHYISALIDRASPYSLTVPFAGYCAYSASTVNIWGIFSKNAQLEARSKENLRHTYRYLNHMKRYWGMFHYMVESAKDRYRQFADAAIKGRATKCNSQVTPMFQYGDWFDKYPHGVSRTDWEDPDMMSKKEIGDDAVMGQLPNLQSVEEFFAGLSPPIKYDMPRKLPRRSYQQSAKATTTHRTSSSRRSRDSGQTAPSRPPVIDLPIGTTTPVIYAAQTDAPPVENFNVISPENTQPYEPGLLDFGINSDLLPHLDRQFVYGAYAGTDASTLASMSMFTPTDNTDVGTTSVAEDIWTDPSASSNATDLTQPSAWFLPFNLEDYPFRTS